MTNIKKYDDNIIYFETSLNYGILPGDLIVTYNESTNEIIKYIVIYNSLNNGVF